MSADRSFTFGDVALRLSQNAYLPLPVHHGQKNPIPTGWQNYRLVAGDEKLHQTASTGFLCGTGPVPIVGLDVDIRDEELAQRAADIVKARIGVAPQRVGQWPKRLFVYRAAEAFPKKSTRAFRLPGDDPEAKGHRVECLAAGQQFVGFGMHPGTGKPYYWNGAGNPLTVPAEQLPVITEAQTEALVRELDELLGEYGAPCGKLRTDDDQREHVHNEQQRGDPALVRSALASIPNDDADYDSWIYVGLAIRGALGDEGLDAWRAWSARSQKNVPAETDRAWKSFRPERVGAGTIFYFAQQNGWTRPAAERLDENISIHDFLAYMPMHRYIFRPNGDLWPAESVNNRLPQRKVKGRKKPLKASLWLDQFAPVEQMTWAPHEPELILDRLIDQGGWINRAGCRVFNLYRPPALLPGDPKQAGLWRMHLKTIYPNEHEHIERWLAHRVQRPGEKLNHCLLLQGGQGIGKDTLLEPVKRAIGPWNWSEISPSQMLGNFNAWARAVVVRVSEARDLGDFDRYAFYDHSKVYMAAPPDVLRVNAKFMNEHYIPNVMGVIITTNHDSDGIYLDPDDRRHFVAGSEATKEAFDADYWTDLWSWYAAGGIGHVAAYLRALDLADFDAKATPPKTQAFWRIVHSNAAPEDAGLADVLEALDRPKVITLRELAAAANNRSMPQLAEFLTSLKTRRLVQHRLKAAGYEVLHNQDTKDGLWKLGTRRLAVYAARGLPYREAVEALTKHGIGQ